MTDYSFEDDESYRRRTQAKAMREALSAAGLPEGLLAADAIQELTRQRDEALRRIALALNVVTDPVGEYQRGGSASDAVQDMTCALEGCTQAADGTWIESTS